VSGRSAVNLAEKLSRIPELWSPRTVAMVNDYDVRLVRLQGEFVRHQHAESDEFFLVISGELTIRFDDGEVVLRPGELYVVPRGVHHQPCATEETEVLLFEPSTIVNTGDAAGERTAPRIEM
jgi:mannose-6-phosphate isomerase-like protein (cupin superfamily)